MDNNELINPIYFINDNERFINSRLSKMSLGELRSAQHITKKRLAEITGLSVKCIADIESQTSGNPTFNSICKYLNGLGYEMVFQKKKV